MNDDYPFIAEHLSRVVSCGGVLLRHEHDWKITGENVDSFGNKSYGLTPVGTDIWYIPKCSFDESLELLGLFGFPGKGICGDDENIRALSIAMILDLRSGRNCAITNVGSQIVNVERIDGPAFAAEEMTRLLEFNQAHFGIKYSKAEFRDLRRLYCRKGFFVIGRM
jgi:hypothetical protein